MLPPFYLIMLKMFIMCAAASVDGLMEISNATLVLGLEVRVRDHLHCACTPAAESEIFVATLMRHELYISRGCKVCGLADAVRLCCGTDCSL